jgi:preprotein translocase subunit SecB
MKNEFIKSMLTFKKYLIKEAFFEINDDYIKNKILSLDFDFDFQTDIDTENNIALINLSCKIFNLPKENNYPFSISVKITGFFNFEVDIKDNIEEILSLNGISILFPYLRSYITMLTSNAGISPLILPTINVAELIKNKSSM